MVCLPHRIVTSVLFLLVTVASAEEAAHPFMQWNRQEGQRIRKLIETEKWAKDAYEVQKDPLLRYSVMGDKAAGEAEKAVLLNDLSTDKIASVVNAYRYDALYDLLTPEERTKVRSAMISAVEAGIARMADRRGWTRWNWLPNLGYAWYSRLHVVAAATGDKQLIRKIWESANGFKWYIDEYLSDLGFYNEEFSKMGNTPQGLVQWAWAMDRLGMEEIGWGYKGRQGASIRGHVDSILRIAMPPVDLANGQWFYPRLTIGDTRGGGFMGIYGLQHSMFAPIGGPGGGGWYIELLQHAYAKWPDGEYGHFLAQLRGSEAAYVMPLRWGVPPIPADVKAPPAASGVYPGRGLIMLRAEEGPEHWRSPAPAVGMRLATPYGHFVADSLCLTGFFAYSRPIFANHAHATNYTGVDPGYSNSARSHSIVMVDHAEPNPLLEHVATRHDFNAHVKFAAARGKGIYKGVDQTRALMLTREYLLDVSHLVSDHARDYLWQIQTFGHACPDEPGKWADSRDLLSALPDLDGEQSCATNGQWAVTAVQTTGGANPEFTKLGKEWFEKRVGVRITMLGESGTRAYTAWSPMVSDTSGQWRGRSRFVYGEEEPSGVAVVATRRAERTTFIAVHEPFEKAHRIREIKQVARDNDGFVVRITGDGWTDYVMLRVGDSAEKPVEMSGDGEKFTFANYGYIRVTPKGRSVAGDVRDFKIPAVVPTPPAESRLVAARWAKPTGLCLPAKGKGAATLKLRNEGLVAVTADLAIVGSAGLTFSPPNIGLKEFAPGAEMDVAITVDATNAPVNELLQMSVQSTGSVQVQRAVLDVANGMATRREQIAADFVQTIYSPRYVAKVWYMDSGSPTELLDPQGFRRNDSTNKSYPSQLETSALADGRSRGEFVKVPRFAYFIPIFVSGGEGQPRRLYEGGRHAHGTQSGMEHLFTEDWYLSRNRNAKPGEQTSFQFFREGGGINSLQRVYLGRDWEVAAEKKPGKIVIIDFEGKKIEAPKPPPAAKGKTSWPKAGAVAVLFYRPDGFDYGYTTLYPEGSTLKGNMVMHPAEKAVGFTFCTEDELEGIAKKWLANIPALEVAPSEAARYHGAFGAQPVAPER